MINQFRTHLLNLSFDETNRNEHIPKGFVAKILPSELLAFHDVLFADTITRADKIIRVNNLITLVASTTFKDAITQKDRRITYQQDNHGDGFTFTIQGEETTVAQRWDCLQLYTTLENNVSIVQRMLAVSGDTKYQKQQNQIYNLANLIVCFVDRVETL